MNRRIVMAASAAFLSLGLAATAQAQSYPTKPITWISPWSAGGGNDILSRAIGAEISKLLGQPVIVENKPGASGVIGTDAVAKAPPDGYMLTLGAGATHATAASMNANLPYDQVKDFTPISLVGTVANVLVIYPGLPVKSVAEMIDYLKKNPGKANYSSVGNGSMQHLAGELFKQEAKVEIEHIPYKGTAPALVDLTAGRIQLAFESMPTVLPMVRSGQLRALAVTTPKRSMLMPDLPTLDESGIKGFDVTIWYGVFGPGGMPKPVVDKLNQAIVASLKQPELAKRLNDLGADVVGSTPEQMASYQQDQIARWSRFIKAKNIKPD